MKQYAIDIKCLGPATTDTKFFWSAELTDVEVARIARAISNALSDVEWNREHVVLTKS